MTGFRLLAVGPFTLIWTWFGVRRYSLHILLTKLRYQFLNTRYRKFLVSGPLLFQKLAQNAYMRCEMKQHSNITHKRHIFLTQLLTIIWTVISDSCMLHWQQCLVLTLQFYKLRFQYVEIKCQLDATEVFIADLIACSTCFGHHYAHHQELKSIIQ